MGKFYACMHACMHACIVRCSKVGLAKCYGEVACMGKFYAENLCGKSMRKIYAENLCGKSMHGEVLCMHVCMAQCAAVRHSVRAAGCGRQPQYCAASVLHRHSIATYPQP